MARMSSGKRYAQAAFELALEKNELESWQEGLKKLAGLAADRDLMALLENPRPSFDAKETLLKERLGEIYPLTFNLALLLVHKASLGLCVEILRQFNELLDAHRGVERAKVIAAIPLSEETQERISSQLGKILDRKVTVEAQVDSSIIGGFVARVEDMLIDGSIRQRLESLRKKLIEARGERRA